MNKIYIGDQEINTGSGGGGSDFNPSDYVDTSTWNEHEKVIASALVNLKSLEDQIEAFDESIQAQETALLAEVHVVEQTKADASTVYTKTDIDLSDKVVAAALTSLNERMTTAESSIGSMGDPTDYSEDILDVSNRVYFIGNLTLDVSSRVSDIEDSYVDASTLEDYTYSKTDIDDKIAAISSSSGPVPSGNFLQYFEVNETGFFFVDASLNIGVAIDSSGLHAPNIVEYNVINE